MNIDQLAQSLKNIGPKTASQLINAGIDTPKKLRDRGAKQAFMDIQASGGFCGCFNAAYLYALEGAILDCDWRDIPEKRKSEFKEFTSELRNL